MEREVLATRRAWHTGLARLRTGPQETMRFLAEEDHL